MNKLSFEAKMLINQNNQKMRKEEFKKTKKRDVKYVLDFDESMINIVEDDSDFKEFKELELTTKLTLLDNYCENKEIPGDIKNELVEMVTSGFLKNKCDINYDKINKKIHNINILKFNEESNSYYFTKK